MRFEIWTEPSGSLSLHALLQRGLRAEGVSVRGEAPARAALPRPRGLLPELPAVQVLRVVRGKAGGGQEVQVEHISSTLRVSKALVFKLLESTVLSSQRSNARVSTP